jgi:signal transduction histidine kinase
VGSGEGGEAAGEDPVPAGDLHLPVDLRDRPGSGGVGDRPSLQVRAPRDALAPFHQAVLVLRVGTTLVCVILATPQIRDGSWRIFLLTILLLIWTAYRAWRPLRYVTDPGGLIAVLAEVAVTTAVVVSTGYWDSPFAFSLLTATSLAGFARGFGFAIRIAIATILAVSLPEMLEPGFSSTMLRTELQWAVEILLVALVTGYSRRISIDLEGEQDLALDRLGRLADANALLHSLHDVAQALPSSLDMDEVLDETIARVRNLFDVAVVGVLLRDDTDARWLVVRKEGVRLPDRVLDHELAPPLRRAVSQGRLVSIPDLVRGGPGLAGRMASGLYAPLTARGAIIGLLAIEHPETQHFAVRDVELLAGLAEPAGLALDNARWFARLRTVGADEERTRIARDLHDRIGQSLAYLAFELDRIRTKSNDPEVSSAVDGLRDDVRAVIGEVRDTLYDLRTDVSDADSLPAILEQFLHRVRERSNLDVTLRARETGRLPLRQERELWRIAQEAITNVERHANAKQMTVVWSCDGSDGTLEIADDGTGLSGTGGRLDSYGILGMRERADAIGATLEVSSTPGRGTRVRCNVSHRDDERVSRGRS